MSFPLAGSNARASNRWGTSVIMQLLKQGKGIFSYLHPALIWGAYEAEIKLPPQHTIRNFWNGFQLTLKISTTIINMVKRNERNNWLLIYFCLLLAIMSKVRLKWWEYLNYWLLNISTALNAWPENTIFLEVADKSLPIFDKLWIKACKVKKRKQNYRMQVSACMQNVK